MSITSLSTHTAILERKSVVADDYGGHSESFATIQTGIPGSLQPASGRLVEEFARLSKQVNHVFYSDVPVTCQAGDRMTIGGAYYLVQSDADQAGRGRVFAVYLLKKD